VLLARLECNGAYGGSEGDPEDEVDGDFRDPENEAHPDDD
jgi:hypothetical protein